MTSPPAVTPELTRYIISLSEPASTYERFFDALLIKRPQHAAFFRDLKAFRQQPHTIPVFLAGTRESNREVTRQFIASRFAHPWCRITPHKQGWFKADWGSDTKTPSKADKDEERLHRLLVPIWCRFRVKMMPSEEDLEKFLKMENERAAARGKGVKQSSSGTATPVGNAGSAAQASRPQRKTWPSTGRADIDSDDDDDDGLPRLRQEPIGENESAAQAANMFVGMAAAGMLLENKRARRYLFKKLKKVK